MDRGVLAVLSAWENNPQVDFSRTVDNPRLFEFVKQVRYEDSVWTQPFGSGQDIVGAFRVQFAHLTADGLQLRRRLQGTPLRELRGLHGEALRLALEKPKGWEYLLFGRVLCDEIEASEYLLREYRLGLLFGPSEEAREREMARWLGRQSAEIRRTYEAASVLLNTALQEALGQPGEPGDVSDLVFVARQLGAAYRHAVEWSQRLKRAHIEEHFEPLVHEMSLFSDSLIEQIGSSGPELLTQVEDDLANLPGPDEPPRQLTFTLTFDVPNIDRYMEEFDKVMEMYE